MESSTPTVDAECNRLAALARSFSSQDGFNARMIDARFRAILPWVAGARSCVELGCADGRMTALLAPQVGRLTSVDGSQSFVDAIATAQPDVEAVCCLFEQFEAAEPYDVAVLAHVLEHVDDPVRVLRSASRALAPAGRAVITVPNANSLHRQVGVVLGLLSHVAELNEGDIRIGHRRVYTRDELVADVEDAGLAPVHVGGIFLKPLSDGQIERQWSPELVDAFHELGSSYPDICANLLVVAEPRRASQGV